MTVAAPAAQSISNLLTAEQEYSAPSIVANYTHCQNWTAEYQRSIADPAAFWAEYAARFQWTRPWEKVMQWDGVHHQWFVGGKTNITLNALDRHANSERRNRAAYIWLGEDGSERMVTYGQLHRTVCRFANGLKSLGAGKGDRVVIYMPLTIEGVVAMLACARIGAIHSQVFSGFSGKACGERIADAKSKVLITADSY